MECAPMAELENWGGNLLFNSEISVCDWPWNVDCKATLKPAETTTPATTAPTTTQSTTIPATTTPATTTATSKVTI